MNLHETFDSIDAAVIDAWITGRKQESVSLDFKLLNDPAMSRPDRKNYAMAMSAFANSSGGLIVWGIDARKNDDGIDCAIGGVPVKPLSLLMASLNSYEGDAVAPTLAGVRHKAVPVGDDQGYAVTLVPESDRGPHMAKLGEDHYYKRAGDSFYRMEHYDIADMFGRRRRPDFELSATVSPRSRYVHNGLAVRDVAITFLLTNTGRGSAYAPYLALTFGVQFKVRSGPINAAQRYGLAMLTRSAQAAKYGGSAMDVIHPGESRGIDTFEFGGVPENSDVADIRIDYDVGADGYAIVSRTYMIPGAAVEAWTKT